MKFKIKEPSEIDPSEFNDDVALQTEWGPANKGGTNFASYQLTQISPERIEFKASRKAFIFSIVFILIGIAAGLYGIKHPGTKFFYIGLFFGVIALYNGTSNLFNYMKPRVFDRETGYFWTGKKTDGEKTGHADAQCLLKDVHAIQLLREEIRDTNESAARSRYKSYEINLILDNGNRLNVIDHGKLSLIRSEAEKLSKFLDVPVWDAIKDKS